PPVNPSFSLLLIPLYPPIPLQRSSLTLIFAPNRFAKNVTLDINSLVRVSYGRTRRQEIHCGQADYSAYAGVCRRVAHGPRVGEALQQHRSRARCRIQRGWAEPLTAGHTPASPSRGEGIH